MDREERRGRESDRLYLFTTVTDNEMGMID